MAQKDRLHDEQSSVLSEFSHPMLALESAQMTRMSFGARCAMALASAVSKQVMSSSEESEVVSSLFPNHLLRLQASGFRVLGFGFRV